jgi:hypothetical protein
MPATLLPIDLSAEALGLALAEALAAGAAAVATPSREEYRAVQAPLLTVAQVRSWGAIHRSAALCNVWQTSSGILIEPTRNGGTAAIEGAIHSVNRVSRCLQAPVRANWEMR